MTNRYSLIESIQQLMRQFGLDNPVTFTATIKSYDPETQTATVRPVIKAPTISRDLNDVPDVFEDNPEIPNVPVMFPRGGQTFIHTPLKEGDAVTCHVNCLDASTWRSTGNSAKPQTLIPYPMHSCWAVPGAFHNKQKLSSDKVDADNLTFGNGSFVTTVTDGDMQVNGTDYNVARADKTQDEIQKVLDAINNWTPSPVSQDGGAAVAAGLKAAIAAVVLSEPSTSRIKVDE